MNYERRSEISPDEIDDFDTDTEGELSSEDDWTEEEYDEDESWDDEPEEREYCD
jgi:hypothetical protein